MSFRVLAAVSAAVMGLAMAAPASAATSFFTNFDSLSVASGSYVIVPSIEGWTATGGDGIEIQNHAAGTPFSESNLVELDSNNNSEMSRLIDAGDYAISFRYSARPGIADSSNKIRLSVDGLGFSTVTESGVGAFDTNWHLYSYTFSIPTPRFLRFTALGTSDSLGGYLDDIRLVGAGGGVPEPATWAMMLAGFGLIGAALRRRSPVAQRA